ncbi:MAG: redoxin domain-containing protein, partial [Isosphaeraceae bacterium]
MNSPSRPRFTLASAASCFLLVTLCFSAEAPALAGDPGRVVSLGSLRGPDGGHIDLSPPQGGLTALVFYSSECPISNAYSPTLASLFDSTSQQPVRWVGVCIDPDLRDSDVRAHARDFGLRFPVARDRHGVLARKLGVTNVPEAVVIDASNRLRYHGRIDDQFARRGTRNANPSGNELKDAIAAVLRGDDVKVPYVPVVGCPLPEERPLPTTPTYCKEVARILQQNCLECHRKGQVGPFPLDSFAQARKRALDISAVVEDRLMPPWKAARDVGGPFQHDRSLAEQDIAILSAWAAAGAPKGNPADLPPPRAFPDAWTLEGGPDLILDTGTDFPVPAAGADIYRCFVAPTNLPRDVYISGIEYRPGNRGVVHHVLAYVDTSGNARQKDEAEPGPGYTCFSGPGVEIHGDLGGWAPGNQPTQLPDGIGRALPSKADVIIQVHYHPSGKAELDRTRIGLRFARKPLRQVLHWNAAVNFDLKVKAGESSAEIRAAWPVPVDVIAHAVVPHMHLLGKDMLMSVTFPDGGSRD